MHGAKYGLSCYWPALEVSLLLQRKVIGGDLKSALQAKDPDLAM